MHSFIVPDLDGPVSGGTLFNRLLVTSLRAAGECCRVLSPPSAMPALARGTADDTFWVDSLLLDQLPRLACVPRGLSRLGLLAHYLPSLVSRGDGVVRGDLGPVEVRALASVDLVLVPSGFMRTTVERLLESPRPILELEPGRLADGSAELPGAPNGLADRVKLRSCERPEARGGRILDVFDRRATKGSDANARFHDGSQPVRRSSPPVRAVMVANLLPGKGVLPFLVGLAARLRADDQFSLEVVGGDTFDVAYAGKCRQLALACEARLEGRLRLCGSLSPEATLAKMASSNLHVSASTMESYGMALAEARTLGLPILASRGGNVQTLVTSPSGGEILADATALARAFLGLCRDPAEHRLRIRRARAYPLPARPWTTVAAEFLRQAELLSPLRGPLRSHTDVRRA